MQEPCLVSWLLFLRGIQYRSQILNLHLILFLFRVWSLLNMHQGISLHLLLRFTGVVIPATTKICGKVSLHLQFPLQTQKISKPLATRFLTRVQKPICPYRRNNCQDVQGANHSGCTEHRRTVVRSVRDPADHGSFYNVSKQRFQSQETQHKRLWNPHRPTISYEEPTP